MRRLTISPLFRASGKHRLSYQRTAQLRLSGRWLESAGFTPGQPVTVRVEQGQLVITTATARPDYANYAS